jgi:flagellar assembly protein FliH
MRLLSSVFKLQSYQAAPAKKRIQPVPLFSDEEENLQINHEKMLEDERDHVLKAAALEAERIKQSALEEAERLKQEALESAGQIRFQAVQEAEQIKENARKEGFQSGRDEGIAQGKKEGLSQTQALYQKAVSFYQEIVNYKSEWLNDWQEAVLELALTAAEKVIRRELENRSIIKEILDELLLPISDSEQVKVHVHPDHFAETSHFLKEGEYARYQLQRIRVIPDLKIEEGTCVVETESGIYDGQLSTQLNEIKKQLTGLEL